MTKERRCDEAESFGALLLCFGLIAGARAVGRAQPRVDPGRLGERVPLEAQELRGAAWRLLPGVGPVLAERLEAARIEMGGALEVGDLDDVAGVGPALLARWEQLWGVAGGDAVR